MQRRELLAGGAAALLLARFGGHAMAAAPSKGKVVKNGRLKQSVSRWCYGKIPLDELCKAAAEMGLAGIDLLDEKEWDVPAKHGLVCSMAYAGGGDIPKALNDKSTHDAIEKSFRDKLPKLGKLKCPNAITFFGNRRDGLSDREAIDNCVAGLNRVKKIAEDSDVTICVELLNSKVDHKGYQGDRTPFGLEVVKAVNSPKVKLLYDIYHMQIMEGDVIRTIRDHHEWLGHFHTGGVPGRHELDETQELQWRSVAKAIVDTGYTGYFAHEFVPTKPDKLQSLREAAALCDV
jgi:hydroxypyruvate isomerase